MLGSNHVAHNTDVVYSYLLYNDADEKNANPLLFLSFRKDPNHFSREQELSIECQMLLPKEQFRN